MAVKKKKLIEKNDIEREVEKKLTPDDLRQIDKQHFNQKSIDYEIKLINMEIEKFQVKLEALLLKRDNFSYKKSKLLDQNRDLLRSISERLKLKNEQFGFDPNTGAIKE